MDILNVGYEEKFLKLMICFQPWLMEPPPMEKVVASTSVVLHLHEKNVNINQKDIADTCSSRDYEEDQLVNLDEDDDMTMKTNTKINEQVSEFELNYQLPKDPRSFLMTSRDIITVKNIGNMATILGSI